MLLFLALFSVLFAGWEFTIRAISLGLCELPFSPSGKDELFAGSGQFGKAVGAHRQFGESDFSHVFPQRPVGISLTASKYVSDFNALSAGCEMIQTTIPFPSHVLVEFCRSDHTTTFKALMRLSGFSGRSNIKLGLVVIGRTDTNAASHRTQDASARARNQAQPVPVPEKSAYLKGSF